MSSTQVTVVGNVATTPDFRLTQNNTPACRFRVATTERRFDQGAGGWVDGSTSFYTVWTYRALAEHAASSLAIGDPVILSGRLRVREREHEGKQYSDAQIDAASIGHDLARGTSAFHRTTRETGERTRGDGAAAADGGRAEPALSGAPG
ncbi:Single-stranded DNA-binding protein 1 [Streptomyces sp. RB5]|uniref:Single-stranded DNA-binding protein n=1 Tax=Streptomyces smaragdinus TaxID=2585196 RepID=A0A7K0CQN4_9ACTN|nr:single-stranded DNA-binding protein [Streptomyces smaragdinus]MQY15064.1 Single-stranded DNA-binding protein 1 [Streptomyces smaragdinus]